MLRRDIVDGPTEKTCYSLWDQHVRTISTGKRWVMPLPSSGDVRKYGSKRKRELPHIQPERLIEGQTCSPEIELAGNDGDVQCMCAGTAAGAWWRQRPEGHYCCTNEALMQAIDTSTTYRQAKRVHGAIVRIMILHIDRWKRVRSRIVSRTGRGIHQ